MIPQIDVDLVVKVLQEAKRVLWITGAGISADSGLPTYRGVTGLYTNKETEDGMPIEQAMSGLMLRQKPQIAWKYIKQIAVACKAGVPNVAHEFIAAYEKSHPDSWVLTQNVDGYHQLAGSKNVIPIHGDVYKTICPYCKGVTPLQDSEMESSVLPKCSICNTVRRPAVVLFGEILNPAYYAILEEQMNKGFDAVFSIGTTSVFQYIAEPFKIISLEGKPAIEINPSKTEVSNHATLQLPYGAGEVFSEVKKVWTP